MTAGVRVLVVVAALAIGLGLGIVLRHLPERPTHGVDTAGLPPGLLVVTAPFCTRCADLTRRLSALGVTASRIDVATHSAVLSDVDVRMAPTLLAVDANGQVVDREDHDFSDERLRAVARGAVDVR